MRRNFTIIAALGAVAALGACSSDEGSEDTAGEEMSAPADKLKPGKYEMTIKVLDMELPEIEGMPGNAEEMFKGMIEQTTYYCLTPEQAEEGSFDKSIEEIEKGENCEIERENNSPSKLDMKMTCKQDGGTMTMDMKGQMLSDGVKVTMDAKGDMAGQTMAFKTEYLSKYAGECDEDTPEVDA